MIRIKRVNAFTDSASGGNPAGVVLDSPDLTDEQMIYISKLMEVSETAYVTPSEVADYKVRFFSPSSEVELCGHATIATFFTMGVENIFRTRKDIAVKQETKAGVLSVDILFSDGKVDRVMMTQDKIKLKDIQLDISEIAESLNIDISEIDRSLPNQIVSTGLYTLPVCIKSYDILKGIRPNFEKVKQLCKKLGTGSFHLFCFDTVDSDSVYHSRNFAPLYGVNEDPVTGTANGAVCGYLLKNKFLKENKLVCEQGDIIGRPGRVHVEIFNDIVKVGGIAKIVEEKQIDI